MPATRLYLVTLGALALVPDRAGGPRAGGPATISRGARRG